MPEKRRRQRKNLGERVQALGSSTKPFLYFFHAYFVDSFGYCRALSAPNALLRDLPLPLWAGTNGSWKLQTFV